MSGFQIESDPVVMMRHQWLSPCTAWEVYIHQRLYYSRPTKKKAGLECFYKYKYIYIQTLHENKFLLHSLPYLKLVMIPGETEPDCFFGTPFFWVPYNHCHGWGHRRRDHSSIFWPPRLPGPWRLHLRNISQQTFYLGIITKITTDIWVWYVFTSSFWDPFNKHSSYLHPTNCAVNLGKLALLLMAQNSCSLADKPLTGSLSSHKVLPSISHSLGALTFSCILHCFTWSVEGNGVNMCQCTSGLFAKVPLPSSTHCVTTVLFAVGILDKAFHSAEWKAFRNRTKIKQLAATPIQ